LATIYSGPGRDDRRYVLEIWTQPRLRWLLAKAYHWYDMRIYKVPGFKQLERWLQSRHRGEELIYVPLSCQQDVRCHFLTERRKSVVATVQLTSQQYCEIKKMLYHGTCDAE
jgi:hypothetical protein